jgi:hypothetical protein
MLKHIALEIHETDLQDFYTAILGGKLSYQFHLEEKDVFRIFNIHQSVDVYYMMLGQLEFELFIHPGGDCRTFNHTCLVTEKARDIYELAKKNNFWTHLRKSNSNETYFLKDKNGNLFEIKNKVKDQ